MTNLTNFGENKLIDKMRGTTPPYASAWCIAFGSAADDASFTEITGADLARVSVTRNLASWAGTQASGSILASTGTSHATSTNADIVFGAAVSDRGTANYVGLFDATTGGNCWAYAPLPEPIVINMGDTPTILAGVLQFSLGLTGGCSDYLANKLIDEFFRGQAYAWPTMYPCLFTTAPTNAGGGVEVSGGDYARATLVGSTTTLSGTQSVGSTSASTGTAGRSSNNAAVAFPAPSADWGVRVADGVKDAATLGNLLFWKATTPKSISAGGSPPSYAPDALGFTFR